MYMGTKALKWRHVFTVGFQGKTARGPRRVRDQGRTASAALGPETFSTSPWTFSLARPGCYITPILFL